VFGHTYITYIHTDRQTESLCVFSIQLSPFEHAVETDACVIYLLALWVTRGWR